MSEAHLPDLTSEQPSQQWVRGSGLRARLLRSHLTIALLGVGLLLAALITVLWTRSAGVRLAEVDGPLAQSSTRTLAGLQHSLAALRGWMAIEDESFRRERRKAWTEEIEPSLDRLEALSRIAANSEEIPQLLRTQELLQDLKEIQWWIEDVAHTPGNAPAQVILFRNLIPIGDGIESAVNSLLDLEGKRGANANGKALLGHIADVQLVFASCRISVRDLVAEGTEAARMRMQNVATAVSHHIGHIVERANLFTPCQQELLELIRSEFVQYRTFCEDIIAMPSQEWRIARHLLATRAAPIAAEVTHFLEIMSKNHRQSMERASSQLVAASNIGSVILVLMVAGMAATATLLSIRSAKRITKPISILARATRDLAAGRLSHDIPVFTTDELGRLTIAFNKMWGALREKERAMRESDARTRAILSTAADGIITIEVSGIIESFNHAAERIFGYSADEAIGRNLSLLMPSQQREEHDRYIQSYLDTGVTRMIGERTEVIGRRKDGSVFPMDLSVNESVVGDHRTFTGIVRDITKRKRAEDDVRRFRAAIDTSADGIFLIDLPTMRFVDASESACASVGYTRDEILTMGPHDIKPEFTEDQLATKFDEHVLGQTSIGVIETLHQRKDGSRFPVEVSFRFLEREGQGIVIAVARDVSDRKRAEQQLEDLHKKMVAASRQAGMAEIATGVLHNVGNVLNSVNVSASVVGDKLRKSKVSSLAKAVGLMHEHAHNLGTFITEDEKGRKLPAYLDKLAEHLAAEHGSMMEELQELTKNIDHIKKIVSTQQSHAGAFGVVETVSIAEVMDDALTVNATSFERYGIEMVREYADLPPISLDKQKLLQILVNLIRNAKHAVLDCDCQNKRLTLQISNSGETMVRIAVIDNGMGIAADNLTKIFSHGFTTKEDGHGFGLHSAALAAKEMSGSLAVHSDGPGKGATFMLDLPIEQAHPKVMV